MRNTEATYSKQTEEMKGNPQCLDLRCFCPMCEERTKETYHRSVSCHNCGWQGTAIIRKGDKADTSKECPHCGVSFTLTFGNDPALKKSA